jgi:release factor glutamine methyltransferase
LRHINQTRRWRYQNLVLTIPPGVFHPGIYFSTPIFLDWLGNLDFANQSVLDVGTGSGALGLFLAQRGARVTAVDINPKSVQTTRTNASALQLTVDVHESDLFKALPEQQFDIVVVNPPYYEKSPESLAEHAFYAGVQLEYFSRFFNEIPSFTHQNTKIWMILSEDCNWNGICSKAVNFTPKIVFERFHWGERLFVAEFVPSV